MSKWERLDRFVYRKPLDYKVKMSQKLKTQIWNQDVARSRNVKKIAELEIRCDSRCDLSSLLFYIFSNLSSSYL